MSNFAKKAKILTGKNGKHEVLKRNAIFMKIFIIGKITAKKESLFARFLAKILDFPETYRILVLIFLFRDIRENLSWIAKETKKTQIRLLVLTPNLEYQRHH
jgi:hypothetical protein